eukprot:s1759_g7.t1
MTSAFRSSVRAVFGFIFCKQGREVSERCDSAAQIGSDMLFMSHPGVGISLRGTVRMSGFGHLTLQRMPFPRPQETHRAFEWQESNQYELLASGYLLAAWPEFNVAHLV